MPIFYGFSTAITLFHAPVIGALKVLLVMHAEIIATLQELCLFKAMPQYSFCLVTQGLVALLLSVILALFTVGWMGETIIGAILPGVPFHRAIVQVFEEAKLPLTSNRY